MKTKISIKEGNVIDVRCDALVLKFAQNFYGADEVVANMLSPHPAEDIAPLAGKYILLPSQGELAAKNVLFVGVVPLYQFDYQRIRKFSERAMHILARQLPDARHVVMTVHGAGYGLDEKESFLAQIAGIFDASTKGEIPTSLSRITIVEKDRGTAARLTKILKENLPAQHATKERKRRRRSVAPSKIANAGLKSQTKPHVFVAMPFTTKMRDVHKFGIQKPIHSKGYLCERTDLVPFTGDVLGHIKSRIQTARLVVADLTGANANVYLEIGYAWGKNRPTVLLARKGEKLKFDVQGQQCIIYEDITDLEKKLKGVLPGLKSK